MEVDGAINADDHTGIGFKDENGNLGIWVKDGGNVGINDESGLSIGCKWRCTNNE